VSIVAPAGLSASNVGSSTTKKIQAFNVVHFNSIQLFIVSAIPMCADQTTSKHLWQLIKHHPERPIDPSHY
jgi:hypothetical protein